METVMDKMTKFDSLDSRLKKLEEKKPFDENIEDLVVSKVEEAMSESREIEGKKLNLILVNIPESNKTEREEKEKDDHSQVQALMNKILPETQVKFSTPNRIGRPNAGTRPRLLKITVESVATRNNILKNASKANNADERNPHKRIYINKDLTRKQRETQKSLKMELKVREGKGELNLMIVGEKIVQRSYRPPNPTEDGNEWQIDIAYDTIGNKPSKSVFNCTNLNTHILRLPDSHVLDSAEEFTTFKQLDNAHTSILNFTSDDDFLTVNDDEDILTDNGNILTKTGDILTDIGDFLSKTQPVFTPTTEEAHVNTSLNAPIIINSVNQGNGDTITQAVPTPTTEEALINTLLIAPTITNSDHKGKGDTITQAVLTPTTEEAHINTILNGDQVTGGSIIQPVLTPTSKDVYTSALNTTPSITTHSVDDISGKSNNANKKAPNKFISIFYSNLDTMSNKKDEIQSIIQDDEPDIICFSEILSKKDPTITKAELEISNYDCFLDEASYKGKRGVIMYVKNSLNAKLYTKLDIIGFKESIWCSFVTPNKENILIGTIYHSPNSTNLNSDKLLKILNDPLLTSFERVYIMGDFNFPHIDWEKLPQNITTRDGQFIEALRDAYLIQHVNRPTRFREGLKCNVLDLILTKEDTDILKIDYCSPLGKSDHLLMKITTSLPRHVYNEEKTIKFDCNKGDFIKFRDFISQIDWTV